MLIFEASGMLDQRNVLNRGVKGPRMIQNRMGWKTVNSPLACICEIWSLIGDRKSLDAAMKSTYSTRHSLDRVEIDIRAAF